MSGTGRRRGIVHACVAAVAAAALTACGMTEYRGPYADIDGTLWRAASSAEDGLRLAAMNALATDADAFFAALPAEQWEGGSAEVPPLDRPVAVVFDARAVRGGAEFSVFVSSGNRPDVPTDAGTPYAGPDSVFTCWDARVRFGEFAVEDYEDTYYAASPDDCPEELVAAMPGTTAFAEPLVFSG